MGTILSGYVSRHHYVIYLRDMNEKMVPIEWPQTLRELTTYLLEHYNYRAASLEIQESSEYTMQVSSETSFRALVPKLKIIDETRIYYVIVMLPFKF